jgi:pyruvate,water dikinase
MLEPSIGRILDVLAADPRLGTGKGRMKLSTLVRLSRFALPMIPAVIHTLHNPEKAHEDVYRGLEDFSSRAYFAQQGDRFVRLADIISFLRDRTVTNAFKVILPRFVPLIGPSIASLGLLTELSGQKDAGDHGIAPLVLEVTRGLPHNVTTEMDLALWETARAIRADPESASRFASSSPDELSGAYLGGGLPSAAQQAITGFMQRYGMRGVGEIDLGSPRWREQPEPVMQTLQSYLRLTDENLAPDVLFARGAQVAGAAIEQLVAAARRQPGGWLKEKLVRGAARRVRALMGVREAPKYYAIRIMGMAREQILAVGSEFAAAGTIERADDLFFLYVSELDALSRNEPGDWKGIIAKRRADFEREARRRQVPRVLASDGRAFYEGLGSEAGAGDVITGSPVSPGVVEGVVHVVFDPHATQLAPGEILVCPGTDPAWTPLFLAAGGLVTEVGGMMTHGSVVAREYGIPAVVGVHQATQRLKDGQRIRLDGTQGKIVLME